MSDRTAAQMLVRINVAIIVVCSILFAVCIWRQLWIPAVVNAMFVATNGFQLATRRRSP